MSSLLEQIQDYFKNTSKEQIEKDWEEIKSWNNIGPTVDEYLESVMNRFNKNE